MNEYEYAFLVYVSYWTLLLLNYDTIQCTTHENWITCTADSYTLAPQFSLQPVSITFYVLSFHRLMNQFEFAQWICFHISISCISISFLLLHRGMLL